MFMIHIHFVSRKDMLKECECIQHCCSDRAGSTQQMPEAAIFADPSPACHMLHFLYTLQTLAMIILIQAQIQLCAASQGLVKTRTLLCIQVESGDVLHERAWSVCTGPQEC